MSKKKPKHTPSLLESESTGGEVAQKGFMFQDGVLLSQLPKWLAHEGFTALTRESIGDTEVKFFLPGRGFVMDLWEAKDHHIMPAEFWREIDRFKEIHEGSPHTYRSFTLASVSLSRSIQSIPRALNRVRDPYEFYGSHSPVIKNSYEEYEARVIHAGRGAEDARFLFDYVAILPDFGLARSDAEALFRQSADRNLPGFGDLTIRETGTLFSLLETLIGQRRNEPISRKAIEATVLDALGERCPPVQPVSIFTTTDTERGDETDLCLEWAMFFGGESREYPPVDDWNSRLLGDLKRTAAWILENRSTRRIRLSGSRRLSASLALGSVFSAVSGFAIDLVYRGEIWSTDAYADAETPHYKFVSTDTNGTDSNLVVVVGVGRDIRESVQAALPSLRLDNASVLNMHGGSPLLSAEHANLVAAKLKEAITARSVETNAAEVHFFLSGPSHLALFLGHRLNATAPVQCYEWTGGSKYVPTCLLYSSP